MNKWLIPVLTVSVVLGGCASVPQGSIPVVDSGSSVSPQSGGYNLPPAQPQSLPEDSGVVVMVPGGGGSSAPIQSFPAGNAPLDTGTSTPPWSASPGKMRKAGARASCGWPPSIRTASL